MAEKKQAPRAPGEPRTVTDERSWLSVWLPVGVKRKLRVEAARREVSMSALALELISRGLS